MRSKQWEILSFLSIHSTKYHNNKKYKRLPNLGNRFDSTDRYWLVLFSSILTAHTLITSLFILLSNLLIRANLLVITDYTPNYKKENYIIFVLIA